MSLRKKLCKMGCDIHMYIEYTRTDEKQFRNFGGRINPGRNYYMFGILSYGVRSDNPKGFEQKGLPEMDTLGYSTRSDARCYISDAADDEGENCTLEQALSWTKSGVRKLYEHNGKPQWVDHPDWHSHSWLTTTEYEDALNVYNEHADAFKYQEPEYKAILAVLKSLEADGYTARVVYWFDN